MKRNDFLEDMLHVLIIMALLTFGLGLTACGTGENSAVAVEAPSSDAPTCPAPTPTPSVPTAVTVLLPNRLIGQIRQIAMGADGWTAIGGSADLVLHCTADDGTVSCEAYPTEPYAYEVSP